MIPRARACKWIAILSALVAVPLAMLFPFQGETVSLPEYDLTQSVQRYGIYFPGLLLGVGLLLLVVAAMRGFSRWFFRWFFRWKILKRLLLAFGIILALIPVFYAAENWRGQRAWENYRHELESHGEKLDFAAYIPPPVPDDQNFAFAPVVMTTWNWLLDTNGHKLPQEDKSIVRRLDLNLFRTNQLAPPRPRSWQLGQATDLAAWQNYFRTMFVTNRYMAGMPPPMPGEIESAIQTNSFNPYVTNEVIEVEALATNEFPVAMQPQTPAADVLLALSKFDAALAELRAAAARPLARFPLGYDAAIPAEILLPHYDNLKNCSLVLGLRANAELDSGHPAEALADIKLIFRLAESIHAEPIYIAQSFRMGWFRFAMQPIWEGVSGKKWTDVEMKELALAMSHLDFLQDYAFAVRSECAAGIKIVEHCEAHGNKGVFTCLCDRSEFNFDMWLDDMILESFPAGWFALGKKTLCKSFYSGALSGFNLQQRYFSPAKYADGMSHVYWEINQRPPWNLWSRMLLPDFKPSRFAETQTQLDLARVAIALERWRRAAGNYPATLDALAPRFLEKIPRDVVNGQPLHYRRTDDPPSSNSGAARGKFLLYSVGWNGVDDGGVPGFNEYGQYKPASGDWVWMFPQD